MAFFDQVLYCNAGDQSTTGYYAVTKWATGATIAAGALRRQNAAPAVNNERVFVCIVAGTTHATTEPTWVITRGGKTTDNTVTWQECTGASAVNGDVTNTPSWSGVTGGLATAITLGVIIKRNNAASYWICSTAGNTGTSEPAWANNTAGTTQTDGTVTWTCLGVVGNFTGGQAPHARVQNACTATWFATGNTVYIGDNHAESQATTLSINPVGAPGSISSIICHNHSGSYPPASSDLKTTATVSTTANVAINILSTVNVGSFYFYGLTFKAGVGASAGSNSNINVAWSSGSGTNWLYFDACSFWLANTAANNAIGIVGTSASAAAGVVTFNNTSVKFASVGHYISVFSAVFVWQNTSPALVSGSSLPTAFGLLYLNTFTVSVVLEALDLSLGAMPLFSIAATTTAYGSVLIKDCKLHASITIPTPTNPSLTVQLVRSDSSATAYKSARYLYEGTETTETSITRVGGATDPTGQAQSRKIVTTANSQWLRPFKAEPYAIWNPTTGANVTVTVCGTVNAGALPNNDDIWLEVEYLGSSASPLGTIVNTTKANLLAANAAVASDGSTWNNTATVYPTWEASSVTAVTLSGGNLVATNTGTTSADQGAKVASAFGLSSGKYYFEITWTTRTGGANEAVGIGTYASTYIGMGNTGGVTGTIAYFLGSVWSGGSNLASLSGWGAGQIMGVAVDLDNRKLWVRASPSGVWNGDVGGTFNPATNVGGLTIPAGVMVPFVTFGGGSGAANNVVTANFGASAFTGAVPSGFTPGWTASIFTPFKLTTTLSSPQPGMAGYLHARVRAAKPSTTYYLDPMVVLS